jgi:predicted ArsR family transcriptional regulator
LREFCYHLAVVPASDMERAVSALRDLTRRDILLRFYADPRPMTADEVAKASSVHRSVAFEHLERLVALGYLETELRRGFVGKPAKLYRLAAGGPVSLSYPARRFDALGEHLADALDELAGPGLAASRRAGRRFGANLAPRRAADLDEALLPLQTMGGEYEVDADGAIVARNCLFLEACKGSGVVCEFHAGVLEGLVQKAGIRQEVEAMGGYGAAGCRYGLRTAEREIDRDAAVSDTA